MLQFSLNSISLLSIPFLLFICLNSFRGLPVQFLLQVEFLGMSVSKLHLLQFHFCSSLSINTPDYDSRNGNGDLFAVNYLSERLGFSREYTLKPYTNVKFRSSRNPDSVLAFLKENDLSDTQIKHLIERVPQILTLKPYDNLFPKIEFFCSLGIYRDDIVKIITVAESLMKRSLENQNIPSFDFVKDMLKSDKDAVDVINAQITEVNSIDNSKHSRYKVQLIFEGAFENSYIQGVRRKWASGKTVALKNRENFVYIAKLAEQAERYDGMMAFIDGFRPTIRRDVMMS